MPNNHTLRIHLEYDFLYVAELRALLTDFERAYNLLEREEDGHTRRVSPGDRLTVKTIETGKSVTLILLGGAALLYLTDGVKKIADARESVWKSEETKWKAKTAKLDFQERQRAMERAQKKELPAPARAMRIIEDRIDIIGRSKNIRTVQVQIDGEAVKLIEPPDRNRLPDKEDK
jgi:hypothetical protein